MIVKRISLNYFVLRMYCPSGNELYSCVCEAYFSKLFCIEQNGISELDIPFVCQCICASDPQVEIDQDVGLIHCDCQCHKQNDQ